MRHCRPPSSCRWEGGFIFNAAPTGANGSIWWSGSAALPIRKICFQPGRFEIRLVPGKPVFLTAFDGGAQTEHGHNVIGGSGGEAERRMGLAASSESLEGHLARKGSAFCPEARWRPWRDGGLPLVRIGGRDTLYRAARPGPSMPEGPKRVRMCCSAFPPSGTGSSPPSSPPTATTPTTRRTPPLWYVWAAAADALGAAGSEKAGP